MWKKVVLFFLFYSLKTFLFAQQNIIVGAEQMEQYLPLIKNKRVGIVSNHTGRVGKDGTLLPDTLLSLGVNVVRLFSPEHGFRGDVDAGTYVKNQLDPKTQLPVISLYGKNKTFPKKYLKDLDVLIFDLQDVGCRFYTYISTLFYLIKACIEKQTQLIILDRPNPNDFVDGFVLSPQFRSFIGILPIPILHGLSVGELALMIIGEGWASNLEIRENLIKVIPVKGWKHGDAYSLPVPPSPNLKDDIAIRLYPSLCFFEATILSVGRGTNAPFTCVGFPDPCLGDFSFTPKRRKGAKQPKHLNKQCFGEDFHNSTLQGLVLSPLIRYYNKTKYLGKKLINKKRTFDLLAGTDRLRKMLLQNKSEQEIRSSWQKELNEYKILRQKYLLYPDTSKLRIPFIK